MDYQARLLKEEEWPKWDAFVASHSLADLHQLSSWGEFQAGRGTEWRFWIIGLFREGILSGGSLVLRRKLPFGKCWLYLPKGPLLDYDEKSAENRLNVLLQELQSLGKRENAVFLRVEPGLIKHGPEGLGRQLIFDWKKTGFRPAHAHYQPEQTLVLDLRGTEKDILAQMKPKGRYNIKLAEKKGIQVLLAGTDLPLQDAVKEFYTLLSETTSRDSFSGHPANYYLEMLEKLGEDQVKLYLAQYEGKFIAGIIVTFYKNLAIYYFGASANQYRNVMAPYLLQWEAVKQAKKNGQDWYDFLGTAPLAEENGEYNYDSKHAWAGVTEFKLKFGGRKVDFFPGMEKVYQPLWYWLIRLRKMFSGR